MQMSKQWAALRRGALTGLLLAGLSGCYGASPGLSSGRCGGDWIETPDRRAGERLAFRGHGTNAVHETEDETLSSFGIDVDDASFRFVNMQLASGIRPDPDAVRVEEFVNHFDYRYPRSVSEPFHLVADAAPSPFGKNAYVLRFALQAGESQATGVRPARIVFAIDTSGSMAQEGRLALMRSAVKHLVARMGPADEVAIVQFANSAVTALPATRATETGTIDAALRGLKAYGGSNVVRGLELAYGLAGRAVGGALDARVILLSDGMANRVAWNEDEQLEEIRRESARGVRLTVVGLGRRSYGDTHLERLAREGGGRYTYLRGETDLPSAFGARMLESLPVVAENVRIQVQFDPRVVRSWRQLGYESRHLTSHQFERAQGAGAHLEAGGAVTALYEVRLRDGVAGELATLRVAYRDPATLEQARVQAATLRREHLAPAFRRADAGLRLAACVAEVAEQLRGSVYARDQSYEVVLEELDQLATVNPPGLRKAHDVALRAKESRHWSHR